jgi:hypothetical protein
MVNLTTLNNQIQNIILHYRECHNVWNHMDVDFDILDESNWFGDGLI